MHFHSVQSLPQRKLGDCTECTHMEVCYLLSLSPLSS